MEIWREAIRQHKCFAVTDPDTTRFHLPMLDWVRFCWLALRVQHGGEIFIPKLRAWQLGDLARAFDQPATQIEARNGDKPAEFLIAPLEVRRTVDLDWAYAIEPSPDLRAVWNYQSWHGDDLPAGWQYSSDCVERLSIDELTGLVNDG